MGLVKKLKLYRIVTVLSIVPKYWRSSKEIAQHVHAKSRLTVYFDMLYCLMKYGASDENYLQFHFYGQDYEYRNSFITWRRSIAIMHYTPRQVIDLFLDKAKFNKRFAKYIHRGWLDCNHATEQQILDFAKQYPTVIIKPMDSSCGVGVRKLSYCQLVGDEEGVKRYAGKNFIVEETIENCEEIKAISPKSLNTIRVTTLMDKNNNVHIVTTNLRVGNGSSITDNFCTGGICCCINRNTGCLEGNAGNLKDVKFKTHPSTGILFEGYKIPHLDEAVQLAIALAYEEPKARLVGWDMVITPTGIDVLEGNIPPAEEVIEFDLKGKWNFVNGLI